MTRDELKTKCLALAAAGDAQAAATLKLFEDYETLTSFATKAQREEDVFRGVTHKGQMIDGVEPRPAAQVPPPRQMADDGIRENKPGAEPTDAQTQAVEALAREFGIDPRSPEAVAAAATRAANGMPPVPAAATTAINPAARIGGFEKAPGADKDGNKE